MFDPGTSPLEFFSAYSFYYPLFMAYVWMVGATFYYFRYERPPKHHRDLQHSGLELPPVLAEYPLVTMVVPCYNEGPEIQDTVDYLLASTYPNFDILLVDDGSSDGTAEVLARLAAQYPKVRAIFLAKNQGKAIALNTASLMTEAQYLCCIDADALLDPNALTWLMAHFASPRVAAVTGNPRVRNRSSLLGKLQVGEFSSVIGLIKRAQRTYGRIFTVSGVVVCCRKAALHDVGYWSANMLTEDVDLTWKLQLRHWDVRFEPKAQCWILAPETLKGLWDQRLRWSTGGIQVIIKNWRIEHIWKARRMWPVLLESLMSALWAYGMLFIAILWLAGHFIEMPPAYRVDRYFSGWNGVVVGTTCLLQIAVSLALDKRYDQGSLKSFFWMIWYPLAYWLLSLLTTVVGVPRALLRNRKRRARWNSPDRGITS